MVFLCSMLQSFYGFELSEYKKKIKEKIQNTNGYADKGAAARGAAARGAAANGAANRANGSATAAGATNRPNGSAIAAGAATNGAATGVAMAWFTKIRAIKLLQMLKMFTFI